MASSGALPISSWAVKRPRLILLLFALLTALGGWGFSRLTVKRFPDAPLPAVSVSRQTPLLDPAEVARTITDPAEARLEHLAGVRHLFSFTGPVGATIVAQFAAGRADDDLEAQVRARVGPDYEVRRLEVGSTPILTWVFRSDRLTPEQLTRFVDEAARPAAEKVPGVAHATRAGGLDPGLNAALDPERMRARGLTVPEVVAALATPQSGPPEDWRIGSLRLGDIAVLTEGSGAEAASVDLDGRPAVALRIAKTGKAGDLAVQGDVKRRLQAVLAAHPEVTGLEAWSSVEETRESLNGTREALIEGMVLAALVVLLFLRDLRATLVVALAMPLSLAPTFAAMWALGFGLNLITLLALTLVIGILVDDAIVEVENIQKLIARGAAPRRAAGLGADSIGLAVTATTLAIVAVFAPVSFMPGVAGRFFKEFGLTATAAVLFSLLVARLLTPMLAARLLRPAKTAPVPARTSGAYVRLLGVILNHKGLAALGALVIVAAAGALIPRLPTEFQPPSDPDYLFVTVHAPPGAGRGDTTRLVAEAEAVLRRQPEVLRLIGEVGAGAPTGGVAGIDTGAARPDPRSARITAVLRPERTRRSADIRRALRPELKRLAARHPGSRLTAPGPFGAADLQVMLSGKDADAVAAGARAVEAAMLTLPQVADPRPAAASAPERVLLRPIPIAVGLNGVAPGDLRAMAEVVMGGRDAGDAARPLRLRIDPAQADLADLRTLPIRGSHVRHVVLGDVAELFRSAGPGVLQRYDRAPVQTIEADLGPDTTLGEAAAAIDAMPAIRALPEGVRRVASGEEAELRDLLGSMGLSLGAGILAMYLVMALLFRSLTVPFTILSVLPMAAAGALAALLLSRSSISLPSLIGVMMLMGLVAKNSILIVELARRREREGLSLRTAAIEACRERARPVIMTSFAMAAGMAPAIFALGAGAEFRRPLALAVIGGLAVSTVASLVLTPVVYELVGGWFRRTTGAVSSPTVMSENRET